MKRKTSESSETSGTGDAAETGEPHTPSTFVGRERELDALTRWLLVEHVRLVSIFGPAGIGKRRLTRELRARVGTAFEGGEIELDLASAKATEDITRLAARALELDLARSGSAADIGRLLARGGRRLLLVHECGHLSAEALNATLGSWLAAAPAMAMVLTSWRQLRLEGERPFAVDPLPLRDPAGADPASALFHECAAKVTSRPLDPVDVEDLVRSLEGIPLAIELAGYAMARFTPAELRALARQDPRHDMHAAPTTSPSVERTLAAAYGVLTDEQRGALAACSVFHGSFDAQAAEEVTAVGPFAHFVAVMQALFDASLIHVEGGPRRCFRMFESIRAFAARELRQRGEESAVLARYRAHFTSATRARVLELEGPLRLTNMRWLLTNEENLHAISRSEIPREDVGALEAVLWTMTGLAWTTYGRGPLAPHVERCRRVGALLDDAVPDALREAAVHFRLGAAGIHRHVGDLERAETFGLAALETARALGAPALVARVLIECARLAIERGRSRDAGELLDEAAAIATPTADTGAMLGIFFAWPERRLRDNTVENVAAMARAFGDHVMMARAEGAMAEQLVARGQNELALRAVDRIRVLANELSERTWLTLADRLAAAAFADLQRFDDARRVLGDAIERSRATGYVRSEGESLGLLGLIEISAGEREAAKDRLLAALTLLPEGDPTRVVLLAACSAVRAEMGEVDEARSAWSEATTSGSELAGAAKQAVDLYRAAAVLARPELQSTADRPAAPAEIRPEPHAPRSSLYQRMAMRLYEQAKRHVRAPPDALVVASDGSWMQVPGQGRIDLAEGSLSGLLLCLAQAHGRPEGPLVERRKLAAALWPSERRYDKATANRLSATLLRLRRKGLDGLLVANARSMGIDADVRVVVVDA